MNIASELHELLHSKWDYAKANELYQVIGENSVYKFMFGTVENSFNSDLLRGELQLLEPQYPFTVQRRAQQKVEEKLPDNVLEIEKVWKTLYKTSNQTRAEIFKRGQDGQYLYPEVERGAMAREILDNFDEIERMWGAVEYFREHGSIPPKFDKAEVQELDPVAMHKRLKNLRTYLSNLRAGRKTYKMSAEEMEAEIAELERKLR